MTASPPVFPSQEAAATGKHQRGALRAGLLLPVRSCAEWIGQSGCPTPREPLVPGCQGAPGGVSHPGLHWPGEPPQSALNKLTQTMVFQDIS